MFDPWIWKMAWRDSRGSRRRLLLFLSSIVVGVAALVAINSFGYNLQRAVEEESRTLLGADMSLESDEPFKPETEALIDSLGGEQARIVSFASMAFFPETRRTRLVTVRALKGAFPFYGEVGTEPPRAARTYLRDGHALVDGALMKEFGAQPGDTVRIGRFSYRIAGRLVKTPRESAAAMIFSPRVYIPLARLDTSLVGFGSRAEYEVYFRFEPERGVDPEALREELRPHRDKYDLGMDTVAEATDEWGEALRYLQSFLGLVGFIALLLGGLGVGSAVLVYVKRRLSTVAVLRCLGASAGRTFRVYLAQALVMGVIGGAAGCALGIGVQYLLPGVVGDFLPIEVDVRPSPIALPLGFGLGVGATVLFGLLPLMTVRTVSPLSAIRSAFETSRPARDVRRILVYVLMAVALCFYATMQAQSVLVGLAYAAGIVVVFGALALVAKGLMGAARAYFPHHWSYPWRQGLANLYRPNNQTLLMLLAVGLSTFLIMVLALVEGMLVARISASSGEDRPDMILFDVQPSQLAPLSELIETKGLPVVDTSPIVSMRIHAVGNTLIDSLRADSTQRVTWAHTRAYRSTYRDRITDAERVVSGKFEGTWAGDGEIVPVSVEEELARNDLHVDIGDTIIFDVQGSLVPTRIASVRRVDWQRMRTNFFFVFPTGVLEKAPQNHVIMTRTVTDEALVDLQAAVFTAFPNVSAISLSLILAVFDDLFGKIESVIRFMALFSILTGILVLVGAVMIGKYQRIAESVLLKTLGASHRQVLAITIIEYLFLGLLATLTGLALAYVAGWALAQFVFEVRMVAALQALLVTFVATTALIMAIGLFNSRDIYERPALEVLRVED